MLKLGFEGSKVQSQMLKKQKESNLWTRVAQTFDWLYIVQSPRTTVAIPTGIKIYFSKLFQKSTSIPHPRWLPTARGVQLFQLEP